MSDTLGVSPDGEGRGPHGIGQEWLSFEQRMRKRRAAKCLLRADLAIEDGNIDDARAALLEARDLDPESTDVAGLEERLDVLAAPVPPDSGPSQWRSYAAAPRRALYVVAGCVLLGTIAFGLTRWSGAARIPETTAGSERASLAATVPLPPAAVEKASASRPGALEVVYETVRVNEATPRLVEALPPPSPSRPVADAESQAEPQQESVVMAVNRAPAPPPPMPATPEVRSELDVSAPAVRLTPPPPPPSEPERSEPEPAEPEASLPVAPNVIASAAPDETAVVRAVLQRYEHAYSSLDAAEASAVWPGVNRGALARAFQALESQRVSLGSCDVNISGPAARATCSGSATWEPKVGGGARTEARLWNFELRKSGNHWQIERAIAR